MPQRHPSLPHTYSEWLQFIYLSSSVLSRPFGERERELFELPGSRGDIGGKKNCIDFISSSRLFSCLLHLLFPESSTYFFREVFPRFFFGKKVHSRFFYFLWVANIFRAKKHPLRTEHEKKYLGQWVTQWHLSNRIVGDNTPFPQIILQAFQQLSVSLKNWSIYLKKKEFPPPPKNHRHHLNGIAVLLQEPSSSAKEMVMLNAPPRLISRPQLFKEKGLKKAAYYMGEEDEASNPEKIPLFLKNSRIFFFGRCFGGVTQPVFNHLTYAAEDKKKWYFSSFIKEGEIHILFVLPLFCIVSRKGGRASFHYSLTHTTPAQKRKGKSLETPANTWRQFLCLVSCGARLPGTTAALQCECRSPHCKWTSSFTSPHLRVPPDFSSDFWI